MRFCAPLPAMYGGAPSKPVTPAQAKQSVAANAMYLALAVAILWWRV